MSGTRLPELDAPGDQPIPEPTIDIENNQYEDLNGDLRWKDSNRLITDIPTRPIYQDEDGTWRFADTHQPTAVIDPNGPEAEVLRDRWGIDPDQIEGAANDLERLVANATNMPVGSGDGVGARGELAAIGDAQANGQQLVQDLSINETACKLRTPPV